jgi:hypothetical protein
MGFKECCDKCKEKYDRAEKRLSEKSKIIKDVFGPEAGEKIINSLHKKHEEERDECIDDCLDDDD